MTIFYLEESINLENTPVLVRKAYDKTSITIGDLHANPIKLLHFLVRNGVCAIDDTSYLKLVELYKKSGANPEEDQSIPISAVFHFREIVNTSLCIIDQSVLVRLIGDELGDRGENDFLTLWILMHLKENNVPYETLHSNHGNYFLYHYHRLKAQLHNPLQEIDPIANIEPSQVRSFLGLDKCCNDQGVSKENFIAIVENDYKPNLKIISYGLDQKNGSITLYSHAPIDISIVGLLAEKFNVPFKDNTSLELASTIDAINRHYSQLIEKEGYAIYCNTPLIHSTSKGATVENVFDFIAWNRSYTLINRRPTHNGFNVRYVHGHDNAQRTNETQGTYTLDGQLGKGGRRNKAETDASLHSNELSLNALLLQRNNRPIYPLYSSLMWSVQAVETPSLNSPSASTKK